MKNFLSSNHWWITSTIIFISAIIQLLIYKTAFSAAYPQSLFLTLLIIFTAVPLIVRKRIGSVLCSFLAVILSVLVFLNKPAYTINSAEKALLADGIEVSEVWVMDGIDINGQIKTYLFFAQDNITVYFNPYSGEYQTGTANKYIFE